MYIYVIHSTDSFQKENGEFQVVNECDTMENVGQVESDIHPRKTNFVTTVPLQLQGTVIYT